MTTALAETFVTLILEAIDESTLFTAELRYRGTRDRDAAIARGVERGFGAALDQLHALLGRMPAACSTPAATIPDGSPN